MASVSIVAMESPGRSAAGGGGGTSAMVGEEVASGGEVASVSLSRWQTLTCRVVCYGKKFRLRFRPGLNNIGVAGQPYFI